MSKKTRKKAQYLLSVMQLDHGQCQTLILYSSIQVVSDSKQWVFFCSRVPIPRLDLHGYGLRHALAETEKILGHPQEGL